MNARVIIFLICCFLVALATQLIFPYFISLGSEQFNVDPKSIGLVMMIATYFGAIFSYLIVTSNIKLNISYFFSTSILGLSIVMGFLGMLSRYTVSIFILSFLIVLFKLFSSFYVISSRVISSKILNKDLVLKEVLSQIKMVLGISGLLAPILFTFIISKFSFSRLILVSSGIFFITALLSNFIKTIPVDNHVKAHIKKRLFDNLPLLFSGMIYFILAGMIYSFIPLIIFKGMRNGEYWSSFYLFLNSIFIVFLSYLVIRLIKNKKPFTMVSYGFSLTCLGLILLNLVKYLNWPIIILSACLFSIGEIICSVLIQNEVLNTNHNQLSSMANYNLFCSGFGLGIGQYLGAVLKESSSLFSSITFIILGFIGMFSFYKSTNIRKEF